MCHVVSRVTTDKKKKDDCSSAACQLENKDVRMGAERERLGAATMISADNKKAKHGFLSVSRQRLAACFFVMSRTTTEDSHRFSTQEMTHKSIVLIYTL